MLKDRFHNSILLFFKRFVQDSRSGIIVIKENDNELRHSDSNPEETYVKALKDLNISSYTDNSIVLFSQRFGFVQDNHSGGIELNKMIMTLDTRIRLQKKLM
ncbi:hypothetical protein AVEN_142409-1 [Araneus ventricosus]|uniref:Uncharacterized protein n=1 Tax=Araneus ventricosus TaxID=182803 RepID=A0A4Y2JUT3_ARAVE|nr:hypothetical protein AVEN_142409-1 [Araneus ventricosus]